MKKIVFTLFLCGTYLVTQAQNSTVEKSIFGVQIGLLGVWIHNEARLSDQYVLRSEIGLDSGIHNEKLFLTPGISLEPKFYYNLNKRASKLKDITGNSSNYVSIKTSYNPNWFVISAQKNLGVADQISIVPTWGIRRNIGAHFNYELGIGIGLRHYFAQKETFYELEAENEATINLYTRIGYRF